MRTGKLLLLGIISASLVGCSDDFLSVDNAANNNNAGLNGKLVKSGLIALGGDNGAETRATSFDGDFFWMPTLIDPSTGIFADGTNQRIGLSWTGRNIDDPDYSAGPLSAKVYTNYEFEHVGWLDKDATALEFDDCDLTEALNGAFLTNFTELAPSAEIGGDVTMYGTPYQYSRDANNRVALGKYNSTKDLNLGKGLFRTENAAVFEGEYLVYFPYTDKFKKGQILATSPDVFDIDVTKKRDSKYKAYSDYAFSIGYVPSFVGGQKTSSLTAKTLSSIAGFKLYNHNNGGAAPAPKEIKKIIMYSDEGILYERELSATKAITALTSGGNLNGKDIYFEGHAGEKTNSIYATLTQNGDAFATVPGTMSQDETQNIEVYFPVLPQEIEGLRIILIDSDDKSIEINPAGTTFASGAAVVTSINLNDHVFQSTYLAVDEESFVSAFRKIWTDGSLTSVNTIKLLKHITLTETANEDPTGIFDDLFTTDWYYMSTGKNLFFNKVIEVVSVSDKANPKLTLGYGQILHIKHQSNSATSSSNGSAASPKLTFKVDVEVAGVGCCGEKPARLAIGGAKDLKCEVEFTKKLTNYGTLGLGAVLNNTDEITINELENGYGKFGINKNGDLVSDDAGKIYFLGSENGVSTIKITTLTNEGDIIACPETINIMGTDVVRESSSTAITKRPVNVTIGTLTNNAAAIYPAAAPIGGKIDIEEGAYIITNVLVNGEGTLIKMYGVGYSDTTDGRFDVLAASSNKGTIDNQGAINFTNSSLINEGLFIDRIKGQVGGEPVNNGERTVGDKTTKNYAGLTGDEYTYSTDLNVAGIYVSQVETDARMKHVLRDGVVYPSTVIVEVLECPDSYVQFNMNDYERDLAQKDVYIRNPKSTVFVANDGTDLTTKSFGHCVTVFNGKVRLKNGILSSTGDVVVKEGAILEILKTDTGLTGGTTVTVGRNLDNMGTTTHTAVKLTVTNILQNQNIFNSNSKLEVLNNLYNMKGTFTSTDVFDVKVLLDIASGSFISTGGKNTLNEINKAGAFTQKGGLATFAANTATEIEGMFTCTGGTFSRLQIGNDTNSRATVNCGSFGSLEGGTASSTWPTKRP